MAYKITEAEYNKLSAEEQEKYTKRGRIRTKLKKFLTNEEKEEFIKEKQKKTNSVIKKMRDEVKKDEEKRILKAVYNSAKKFEKEGYKFNVKDFEKFMKLNEEAYKNICLKK